MAVRTSKVYTGWFLAPALILYTVLFVVPVVVGLAYSLTNWNSMSDVVRFVGLKNFREIFTAGSPYLKNLGITLVFTVFTLIVKEGCGLGLALLLNGAIRSKSALRGVFFLPQTLSPLIIGIVFVSILSPSGVVNALHEAPRPRQPGAALAGRPQVRARHHHPGGIVADDRLEHGDPAGGAAGHSARLLRSGVAGRRVLSGDSSGRSPSRCSCRR